MRICLVVAAALASIPSARADPETKSLGNGYSLQADHNQVYIRKGSQTAPLAKGSGFTSVKVDTKAKAATVEVEDATCVGSTKYTWSFDHLDARLENAASFAAVKKKDYKAAAAGFERAVARDPKWNIAAYNLASAYQLAGDKAKAVAALAPWLASKPVATYLQVTIDPDLAPLLDCPELKALRAKQPGSIKITADGITGGVAYDPARNLIAFSRLEHSGSSMQYIIEIEIWDVAARTKRASHFLVDWADSRPFTDKASLTAAGKIAVTKRAAMLEKLLGELGFQATPTEVSEEGTHDDDKIKLGLPKAKLGVVGKDDTARALRGNTVVGTAKIEGKLLTATLIDAAKTIVLTSHRGWAEGCDRGPEIGVYLMKLQ